MYNQLLNKKLGLLLAALLSLPGLAFAENQSGFYEKNAARSVFAKSTKIKKGKEIEMLIPEKLEVEEPEVAEAVAQKLQSAPQTPVAAANQENTEELSVEEQLAKKYGNPMEEFPVTGVSDAPKPFQAMIEALDKGDKELAFKYAVQYVRYRRQLEQVTNQAVSLVGQGYVREGILPADSWASSPEHQENFYLRNLDLGEAKLEEKTKEQSKPVISKLTLKAQEIIKRTKEEKFNLVDQEVERIDTSALKIDEKTERETARKELKGKVPVDPKGQVDIYFFFEPQDPVAIGIAKDAEAIFKISEADEKLEFVGVTLTQLKKFPVERFQKLTGSTFPIISGQTLASQMGVKKSPSLVFVCRNSSLFYQLPELKSLYYLEELIKVMKGQK